MVAVVRLTPVALALAAIVTLAVGSASATRTRPAVPDQTTARAFAVQVAVPGQAGAPPARASAPPYAVAVGGSSAPRADGSVVIAASVASGAFASPGSSAPSSASA